MKISKYLYGFLVLFLLLGGIGVAKVAGVWQVSAMYKADGSEVVLTGTTVEDIKGYMSIQEIIDAYEIDKDGLYQYLNFPDDLPTSTLVKDIKKLTGIDPEPIKDYIELEKGLTSD